MSDRTLKAPAKLTGWHVLAIFALFFGVDIAVNTYFIVSAVGSYPGEVSTTPYEDGLAYDKVIDQGDAQATLGWRVDAGFRSADVVEVSAVDHAGRPLALAHIDATLERPATTAGRQVLRFAAVAPGVYRAPTARSAGAWDLTLNLVDGQGHRFDGARRLMSP